MRWFLKGLFDFVFLGWLGGDVQKQPISWECTRESYLIVKGKRAKALYYKLSPWEWKWTGLQWGGGSTQVQFFWISRGAICSWFLNALHVVPLLWDHTAVLLRSPLQTHASESCHSSPESRNAASPCSSTENSKSYSHSITSTII